MSLEIERKFLVVSDIYKAMSSGSEEIAQGYLGDCPERTVRVRIKGEHGYLTVKGITRGCVRHEWEYEVPLDDARQMLGLCAGCIVKRRWYVPYGGHTWEVDEFGGTLATLVVAEVELSDADEAVDLPPFVGREVTGDARYYNSSLAAGVIPGGE